MGLSVGDESLKNSLLEAESCEQFASGVVGDPFADASTVCRLRVQEAEKLAYRVRQWVSEALPVVFVDDTTPYVPDEAEEEIARAADACLNARANFLRARPPGELGEVCLSGAALLRVGKPDVSAEPDLELRDLIRPGNPRWPLVSKKRLDVVEEVRPVAKPVAEVGFANQYSSRWASNLALAKPNAPGRIDTDHINV